MILLASICFIVALVLAYWAGYGYGWNAGRGRTMEREELKSQRQVGAQTIRNVPEGHKADQTLPEAIRRATTVKE